MKETHDTRRSIPGGPIIAAIALLALLGCGGVLLFALVGVRTVVTPAVPPPRMAPVVAPKLVPLTPMPAPPAPLAPAPEPSPSAPAPPEAPPSAHP